MQMTLLRHRNSVILTILIFLFFRVAHAQAASATLVVPTDFSNIQSAIDNAALLNSQNTGTTYDVLVERGDWSGGGITLKSGVNIRGREAKETFLSGGSVIMSAVGVSGVIVSNFTFRNATTGVSISGGSSSVRLFSNIFALNGTGVIVADTSAAAVEDNTFYQNAVGISRANTNVSIVNNIFSSTVLSSTGISQLTGLLQTGIQNNDFNPTPPAGAVIGTNSLPDTIRPNPDPLFVDAPNFDFHLQAGSPCIDTGFGTDKVASSGTGTAADIGAYGGQNVDTIPAQVTGLTSSSTTTSTVQLSWSKNLDYLVQGYRVYYGYAPGVYNGTDAVVSGSTPSTSPIDLGNATSLLISGLTRTVAPPTASPIIVSIAPANGSLTVSWTAVSGASSYNVYYQELPAVAPAVTVSTVNNIPSYTLTGLKNGTWYSIQVSALAQSNYYFAVTSYYQVGGASPGNAWESAYSAEQTVLVGPALEGPLSDSAQGAPDELIPAPNLKNSGCFIATAAYGSYDAPAVRILRAFRDRFLAAYAPGRAFIAWYYRTSPRLAERLNGHPALKPLVRIALEPVVAAAFLMTEAPRAIPAVLLLAAAAAIYRVRRRRRAADISRS